MNAVRLNLPDELSHILEEESIESYGSVDVTRRIFEILLESLTTSKYCKMKPYAMLAGIIAAQMETPIVAPEAPTVETVFNKEVAKIGDMFSAIKPPNQQPQKPPLPVATNLTIPVKMRAGELTSQYQIWAWLTKRAWDNHLQYDSIDVKSVAVALNMGTSRCYSGMAVLMKEGWITPSGILSLRRYSFSESAKLWFAHKLNKRELIDLGIITVESTNELKSLPQSIAATNGHKVTG